MLKKQYQPEKETCKVTFTIEHGPAKEAKIVALVGDFNNWDVNADPMKRGRGKGFAKIMKLPCGHSYQLRYLIDGSIWENDAEADGYAPTPFGDSDNSIVNVQS